MRTSLFLLIAIIITSCNNKSPQDSPVTVTQLMDTIQILPGSAISKKIVTCKTVPEQYQKKIVTSAIVRAIPNNYAEIASPFSGRITRSFVCLGQKIAAGDPVFEISSPTFFEAGKNYYQSKQEMELAEKNLKRQQDLFNNGVGIQKDLEETEVSFELAKRDFENSIASLRVYQVDPEELVLGHPLIVRSPINGEIVENKIVIGQYLKEDAEPVAIVAELSSVWVIGQLKEKDIASVHNSDEVEINLTGMPGQPIQGKVFHIGEMLDEATRSVQVYVTCENENRIMKPGMFVTTQFSENADPTILVPSTAIYQMENSCYIFISLGNNRYIKKDVLVGGTDEGRVIIKSGLTPGDVIVIEGGMFLLNLEN